MQAFETEGLIGAGAAPAVLSYLFHRIEDRFDGREVLLELGVELRHHLRHRTIAHGAYSRDVRTRSANHCA